MEFGVAFATVAEKLQGEEEATKDGPRGQHSFSPTAAARACALPEMRLQERTFSIVKASV
jgi:hypothetical protein